jgi:hypothetical protein
MTPSEALESILEMAAKDDMYSIEDYCPQEAATLRALVAWASQCPASHSCENSTLENKGSQK